MEALVSPTPAASVLVLADSFMTARCSCRFGPGPLIKAPISWIGLSSLVGNYWHSGFGRINNRLTDVLAPIMAWWITFTVVLLLLFAVGFNPIGIGAGMTHP